MVVLVFLTGCSGGSKEVQRGLDLRSELLKASECRFSCGITADYSDKVYTFSMDCQCEPQGNLTFAVTAPETITGITGKVSDAGGKLTFDDTALQFDLMAEEQLTPVSAPWSHAPQAAASSGGNPAPSSAVITPASTSPLPPTAIPGFPVGLR